MWFRLGGSVFSCSDSLAGTEKRAYLYSVELRVTVMYGVDVLGSTAVQRRANTQEVCDHVLVVAITARACKHDK